MNKGIDLNPGESERLTKELNARRKLPSSLKGPGYRIYYVRYADDFLIGVNGTRNQTVNLKEEINEYLVNHLRLNLNLEKTKITNAKKDKAHFLGAEIYRPTSRNLGSKEIRKSVGPRSYMSRIPATKLALHMPVKKIVQKLQNQQLCEIRDYEKGQIYPTGKASWINLDLKEILLRYNLILRGFDNYYSFAENRSRMQFIQYILHHSCALLFSRKLKLHSRANVFATYGRELTVRTDNGKKTYKLNLKKNFKKIGKFLINPPDPLDIVYNSLRSKSKLGARCSVCQSDQGIEMHHVKSLKGKTAGFMDVMRAMNRKQIPVCRACHQKIHDGTYDGLSLKDLHSN
jgi:hypothetical protein